MKISKKILGVVLVLTMILNVFAVGAFAAFPDDTAVKLMIATDKETYAPGDEIVLTVSEQNSIGNWFELVGQIILTFNAQGSNQLPPSPKQYCDLEKLVYKLNNEINILKNKINSK